MSMGAARDAQDRVRRDALYEAMAREAVGSAASAEQQRRHAIFMFEAKLRDMMQLHGNPAALRQALDQSRWKMAEMESPIRKAAYSSPGAVLEGKAL